jgi:soluble lytic murein transglycosylase
VDIDRANDVLAKLQKAPSAATKLPDYLAYYTAAAAFGKQDYDTAARAAQTVAGVQPFSPLSGKGALLGARALLEGGNPSAAAVLLRKSSAAPQPQAVAVLAQALQSAGDAAGAAAAWQRVYYGFPSSDEARDAGDQLTRLRDELGEKYPAVPVKTSLERAYRLAGSREAAKGKRELEELVPQTTGADRDTARVRICAADYNARKNAAAYTCLQGLEVSTPEADAERLQYLVLAARRLDKDDDIPQWVTALDKYPKSTWRLKALVAAGNEFVTSGEPEKAEVFYKACADGFSSNEQTAACHWRVVWTAWMRRDPQAKALMLEHLERFPWSDKAGAALYFLGNYGALFDRYPNSYYTGLARQKGAQGSYRNVTVDWTANAATGVRLERARLLAQVSLEELAEAELRFAAKNDTGVQANVLALELAEIANQRGAPESGVRHIKAVFPDYLYLPPAAAPDRFWRLVFPLPYRAAVERNCATYSLDPYLFAGLIRQESEFDTRIVSHANAYGLSQVLPSTARHMARSLGIQRFRTSMLYEPNVNLRFGTAILRRYLDQYDGNLEAALASYNGGPNRVKRWLNANEYREPAEFIESIPLSETRNYVQTVLRNAEIYRRLYGKPGQG